MAVIGAGPAGLAAAVHAAEQGAATVLLDSGARLGGQYWRHADDAACATSLRRPRSMLAQRVAIAALLPRSSVDATQPAGLHHDVVDLPRPDPPAGRPDRRRPAHRPARAPGLVGTGGRGRLHRRRHRPPGPPAAGRGGPAVAALVLAVGAYDRQVPVPRLGPARRAHRGRRAGAAQGQRGRGRAAGAHRRYRAVPATGRHRAGCPGRGRARRARGQPARPLAAAAARRAVPAGQARRGRRVRAGPGPPPDTAAHPVRGGRRTRHRSAGGGDRGPAGLRRPGPRGHPPPPAGRRARGRIRLQHAVRAGRPGRLRAGVRPPTGRWR